MSSEILLTKGKVAELEARLDYLERVEMLKVAEEIKEARALGDLSENAEYDAAKDRQAVIAGEIQDIKYNLAHATIIDEERLSTKSVSVGCTVEVQDLADKEKYVFKLVGTAEANVREGRISNESPMGRALIGKKKGEEFSYIAPCGKLTYKVLSIKLS